MSPYTPAYGYAGFYNRISAWVLDSIILTFLYGIVGYLWQHFDPAFLGWETNYEVVLRVMLWFYLLSLFYFAAMESSSYQGTIGALRRKIIITDLAGQRIGFFRATVRHLLQIVSILPFYAGFLGILFTSKKQALHDFLSGCLVVNAQAPRS